MRVLMADTPASHLIIDDPRVYQGISYPVVGQAADDSQGRTGGAPDGGTISSTWVRWFSDTAGIHVYGGRPVGL
jgi:hypothetical protein